MLFLILVLPTFAAAKTFQLQDPEQTVIGEVISVKAEYADTLLDIARRHNLGYHEIKLLNPHLDTWLPGKGEEVILPLQFILPQVDKEGIVLNIPEMRLYYFSAFTDDGTQTVITHPLGIGREGWSTPYIDTRIIQKKKDPKWYPPESIRKEHEELGNPLPEIVEAGPDNPLGAYAMRLGNPDYLIHGTNRPYGVGMRVSHGCIRLYPEDIESLFHNVDIGTRVNIINQPYKAGIKEGVIYLEAHPHLDEDASRFVNLTEIVKLIIAITGDNDYEVDWNLVDSVVNEGIGIPVAIGKLVAGSDDKQIVKNDIDKLDEATVQ